MLGDIVVVGSLNMDLVVRASRHPEVGETILGSNFHTYPGGKGANQAVAAARLGGHVKMIGRVGKDAFGTSLLDGLAKDGVDTRHIYQDPDAATGVALITVNDDGQNTIVVASGANARLTPDQVSAAEEAFHGAAVVLLQLETPLPTVQRAVQLGRHYGAQIILNPAPAQSLPRKLLSSIDYLVPNRSELALLSGVEDPETAVNLLRDVGIGYIIVTLGEEGVLIAGRRPKLRLPAHRVETVDTTAAGDAFVGAFAVALAEGKNSQIAAEWGNAAGALAATKHGAQPSLPTRSELEAFCKS